MACLKACKKRYIKLSKEMKHNQSKNYIKHNQSQNYIKHSDMKIRELSGNRRACNVIIDKEIQMVISEYF